MLRRLCAVLLLMMATLPAGHAGATPADAGALLGTLRVGSATCGTSTPGLDILSLSSTTTGEFGIEAHLALAAAGPAELLVCGVIGPGIGGIGASCVASRGHGGVGTLESASGTLPIQNFGWGLGAAGTLFATGYAGTGIVVGVLQAYSGANCLTEATAFVLAGTLALVGPAATS